jgi:hypothetical protein
MMSWFDSLPPADATVPCGSGRHIVRWEAGQLTLPAHPDAEAEMVLGALGGDKPGCVALAQTWDRHADDLAVLTAGPRCTADLVSVSQDEIAEQRANLPVLPPRATPVAPTPAGGGRRMRPGWIGPGSPASLAGPSGEPGMAEYLRHHQRRIELLELLALGPALQFRLSGAVSAAWSGPDRADQRTGRRPEFAAALTGRFAPAAGQWLGIDPDAVTVIPHEGPAWGALEVSGTGTSRRLRAWLPVGWLADVWACGLAVLSGLLVVAVAEPGYPRARVLALPAPDAEPIATAIRAAGVGPAGLPAWQVVEG